MIRRFPRFTPPSSRTLRRLAGVAALLVGGVGSTGCAYRIIRRDDIRVRRFAADSAALVSLQKQVIAIRAQCRADSVRAATDRAALDRALADKPGTPVSDSTVKARDAEIATLKDQLAKANAELDRIKRRLATPRSE